MLASHSDEFVRFMVHSVGTEVSYNLTMDLMYESCGSMRMHTLHQCFCIINETYNLTMVCDSPPPRVKSTSIHEDPFFISWIPVFTFFPDGRQSGRQKHPWTYQSRLVDGCLVNWRNPQATNEKKTHYITMNKTWSYTYICPGIH